MSSLNFDTGIKTFTINNDESRTITFNPADYDFIKRLESSYEKLEAAQNRWAAVAQAANGDVHQTMAAIDGAEKEIRDIIDEVFGGPVCDIVFRGISAYALASGAPLWANFLLAVYDECDANFIAQEKAASPRLQKLMKKYGKK